MDAVSPVANPLFPPRFRKILMRREWFQNRNLLNRKAFRGGRGRWRSDCLCLDVRGLVRCRKGILHPCHRGDDAADAGRWTRLQENLLASWCVPRRQQGGVGERCGNLCAAVHRAEEPTFQIYTFRGRLIQYGIRASSPFRLCTGTGRSLYTLRQIKRDERA